MEEIDKPGPTSTLMDQQKMPYEMEDVAFSSKDHDCLLFHYQNQAEGSLCSNYKAELLALYNATETLKLGERKPPKSSLSLRLSIAVLDL